MVSITNVLRKLQNGKNIEIKERKMILTAQIFSFFYEYVKNDVTVPITIKSLLCVVFEVRRRKWIIYHKLFDIKLDIEHAKITGDIP